LASLRKSARKPSRKPALPETIATRDLARLLGVTPRWLQQLRKDGVLASSARGRWPLLECVHAYIAAAQKSAAAETDTNAQRARLLKEQADRTHMENATTRGELIEVGEVEQKLQAALVDLVQFLDSLGSRVAGTFPSGYAAQAKALIDDEVSKAREDLAEQWSDLADPEVVAGGP